MIRDLTGQKFARLLVVKDSGQRQCKKVLWLCVCECGKQQLATGQDLLQGKVRSCGCLHAEQLVARNKENATHSSTKTRLYHVWLGMKKRCYNKGVRNYKDYGGRGIRVCRDWVHNFSAFKEWAIKSGYKDELSLERLDVDNGYSPNNCTWIPLNEQNRNKRNTVRYNGEPLGEVAKKLSLNPKKVYRRVYAQNWPIEEALELVPHVRNHERFLQSRVFHYRSKKKEAKKNAD